MDPIESFEHADVTVDIFIDTDPRNPRTENENVATFVCFHKKYKLGDVGHDYNTSDYNGWAALKAAIMERNDGALVVPLYLYDHSGITISSTPFDCRWDSGQIGFAFITKAQIADEWGTDPDALASAEKYLQGEVETYDQYLRNDVYGFVVRDASAVQSSCWGFYGIEHCRDEAKATALTCGVRRMEQNYADEQNALAFFN
ncbi:MAG: hypothetical protein GZ088_09505 [Acidipila sp.]|nr:hypothetical protein [Acidipila sp.]